MGMIDLDELVEGFRLNVDRLATERLIDIAGLIMSELGERGLKREELERLAGLKVVKE